MQRAVLGNFEVWLKRRIVEQQQYLEAHKERVLKMSFEQWQLYYESANHQLQKFESALHELQTAELK